MLYFTLLSHKEKIFFSHFKNEDIEGQRLMTCLLQQHRWPNWYCSYSLFPFFSYCCLLKVSSINSGETSNIPLPSFSLEGFELPKRLSKERFDFSANCVLFTFQFYRSSRTILLDLHYLLTIWLSIM